MKITHCSWMLVMLAAAFIFVSGCSANIDGQFAGDQTGGVETPSGPVDVGGGDGGDGGGGTEVVSPETLTTAASYALGQWMIQSGVNGLGIASFDSGFSLAPAAASINQLLKAVGTETCGNGICEYQMGENFQNCTNDCHATCPNGQCEGLAGENEYNCPADCSSVSYCGNQICNSGEDATNCPADCPKTNGFDMYKCTGIYNIGSDLVPELSATCSHEGTVEVPVLKLWINLMLQNEFVDNWTFSGDGQSTLNISLDPAVNGSVHFVLKMAGNITANNGVDPAVTFKGITIEGDLLVDANGDVSGANVTNFQAIIDDQTCYGNGCTPATCENNMPCNMYPRTGDPSADDGANNYCKDTSGDQSSFCDGSCCFVEGSSLPNCGNQRCDPDENATNCPIDCSGGGGSCGDGNCDANESNATCSMDCSSMEVSCDPGSGLANLTVPISISDLTCYQLGFGLVDSAPAHACTAHNAQGDPICDQTRRCNDELHSCDVAQRFSGLSNDAACQSVFYQGNPMATCDQASDCCLPPGPYCGDNHCDVDNGETAQTCPQDCGGSCNYDSTCDVGSGETYQNCNNDCYCHDSFCDSAEQNDNSCPDDCGGGGGPTCADVLPVIPTSAEASAFLARLNPALSCDGYIGPYTDPAPDCCLAAYQQFVVPMGISCPVALISDPNGNCIESCGDTICEPGIEDSSNCPADCGGGGGPTCADVLSVIPTSAAASAFLAGLDPALSCDGFIGPYTDPAPDCCLAAYQQYVVPLGISCPVALISDPNGNCIESCGDTICEPGIEDSSNCPADCGAPAPSCADGIPGCDASCAIDWSSVPAPPVPGMTCYDVGFGTEGGGCDGSSGCCGANRCGGLLTCAYASAALSIPINDPTTDCVTACATLGTTFGWGSLTFNGSAVTDCCAVAPQ